MFTVILRPALPANYVLRNVKTGKLTTNWQKFRWHADGILITVEKFRVRTHHNALRFTSVSHITVGLAQARPNKLVAIIQFVAYTKSAYSR